MKIYERRLVVIFLAESLANVARGIKIQMPNTRNSFRAQNAQNDEIKPWAHFMCTYNKLMLFRTGNCVL